MSRISVIVPVYNVENYLDRCVKSILKQTYTDFELILVDDGATDHCGEICDRYAALDERVRVIHKINGGLSDARNAGINIAQGAYLTFIDSDDWVEEKYLETLYTNIQRYDADISVVNLHIAYDTTREKATSVAEGLYTRKQALDFLYNKNMGTYINVAWAKLYRRELFAEIRYPYGRLHEDGFTTYKLLGLANKVYFSNMDLYCYYHRENSIMHRAFSLRRLDEYDVYLERKEYFKNKKLKKLYAENERVRISCMKSLSVKLIHSEIDIEEIKRIFSVFRKDMFRSLRYQKLSKSIVGTVWFCVSPWGYAKNHKGEV